MKRQQKFRFVGKVMVLCLAFTQVLFYHSVQDDGTNQVFAATAERPLYKATWLWNTGSLLVNKVSTFQFLQQNEVNLLFLQVDPDVSANDYKSFIQEASARGMEVHALGGAPDWILPEQQMKLYKLINWVKTYNNSVTAAEQFRGIHLDVEPYVMKSWYADTDTMLGLWRDTVSGFVEEMEIETPGLIAGADMPVWLEKFNVPDGLGGRTTLSNWMIRKLDQVTLMAYRDHASDIISSIATEMEEAERNGKPAIVAVETLPSSDATISYFEKGKFQMMRDLSTVGESLGNRASFAGYAVHDYDGWIRLKE
ncbi:hypothetical protein [Paenibacillus sedimenti]|uniref:Amidase n=1 Tax=Paenibacillus sedimenti TaxID=2770274 RepID=A0A926QLR9_9BACL|nr:hypothetical protein [Paenibacillus sedimenti]MBD0384206.1 hypothetical protein [Paenibacillus sedimenti]